MKTARQVLKADEVALQGPLQLSIDPIVPGGCDRVPSASTGPSVRLAQTHAEYAVIEVTCPCGRTTYVRCDYAPGNSAPAQEGQAQS
jgi:hypothetical protein